MENKIIGFVGLDVQDTILYLSRIFYHMGKSVLMADYSESQALYYSIPLISGMDADSMLIEYRDTFFTCGPIREKEMQRFDVVMIFFGFEVCAELDCCTHIIYTTDYEKNHIEKLGNLKHQGKEYSQLVYRNAGKTWDIPEYGLPLAAGIREECRYICNDSSREKALRFQCQYNEVYGFRGISAAFRKYLKATVRAVFPEEAAQKKFQVCFKRAEMGA